MPCLKTKVKVNMDMKVNEKHLPTVAIINAVSFRRHVDKESSNGKASFDELCFLTHYIPYFLRYDYQPPGWI